MTFPSWLEVKDDTTGDREASGVFISLKDKAAIDTICEDQEECGAKE
jgi:hypothetical protein